MSARESEATRETPGETTEETNVEDDEVVAKPRGKFGKRRPAPADDDDIPF